jgi:hypothetical protein
MPLNALREPEDQRPRNTNCPSRASTCRSTIGTGRSSPEYRVSHPRPSPQCRVSSVRFFRRFHRSSEAVLELASSNLMSTVGHGQIDAVKCTRRGGKRTSLSHSARHARTRQGSLRGRASRDRYQSVLSSNRQPRGWSATASAVPCRVRTAASHTLTWEDHFGTIPLQSAEQPRVQAGSPECRHCGTK